jgi:hypothetical protein
MMDTWQPQIVANQTVLVAASDSSAKVKATADFVCDGTNDEVTIQAAIAALPTTSTTVYTTLNGADTSATSTGGTVFLAAGTYNIDGVAIDLTTKLCVVLRGEGAATVIKNNQTDGGHAIEANVADPSTSPYPWRCEVRDMMVMGNADSGYGVYFFNGEAQRIHNVHFIHNGDGGAYIGADDSRGQNNKIVSECQFVRNYGYGLHMNGIHETLITSCHFEENGGTTSTNAGLYANAVTDLHVSNCSVEDHDGANGVCGMKLVNVQWPLISNTTFEDDVSISLNGGYGHFTSLSVSDMTLTGSGSPDVYITGSRIGTLTMSSINRECFSGSHILDGTVSGGQFLASACDIAGVAFLSMSRIVASGCKLAMDASSTASIAVSGGVFQLNGTLSVSSLAAIGGGVRINNGADRTIAATADSVLIDISGAIFNHNYVLAIDGDGHSNVRSIVSGCNGRYTKLKFEDIGVVSLTNNILAGGGTITFENCDDVMTMVGNTIWSSCHTTIAATCAATQNIQTNTVSASNITNNGTGAITNANNVVASGTGWNP